jgi:uncharacterized protein YjgD (DUF1641 family)
MAGATGANGHHPTAAEQLLERLNEPRTAEALNRLLDHADLLAYSAGSLDGFLRRGEEIADNVAASIDEVRHVVPSDGLPDSRQLGQLARQLPQLIDLTNRVAELSQRPEFTATLDTLSDPQTLTALNKLLQHMEMLEFLVGSLDAFLQRGEEIADNVRSSLEEVGAVVTSTSIDRYGIIESMTRILPYIPRLVAVAPKFIEVIERLEVVVSSPEFDALLNSGIFHADTVALVGRAGDAFVESYDASKGTDRRIGVIGLLRVLNDPDIQRAAALVTDFGKRFGSTIK